MDLHLSLSGMFGLELTLFIVTAKILKTSFSDLEIDVRHTECSVAAVKQAVATVTHCVCASIVCRVLTPFNFTHDSDWIPRAVML